MPTPMPVTSSSSDVPQPSLAYASARPAALSSLIEHLGPGYVVVKLVSPSKWLEAARLAGLVILSGLFLAALGLAPKLLTQADRGGDPHVEDLIVMGAVAVPLAAFTVFAVAGMGQGRRLLRRLLQPEPPAGSITLRRPEVLTDARDSFMVLRVTVESPMWRIAGAYLRVETPSGRVLELLRGHGEPTLQKLCADLKAHLLVSRVGVPDAVEVQ